jgi:glycosyltransferase involved in cell wall biosynthesis
MNLELNSAHHNGVIGPAGREGNSPHVAVLFYRFGPYHHARLKAAGARMQVTGVEFSNVDPLYKWDQVEGADGFRQLTLFSGVSIHSLTANQILRRVTTTLDQISPQAVALPGWSDRCSLAALWWCLARKIPAIIMSETSAWDFERMWLKEAMKRRLVKMCGAGLVGGRSHLDYLEKLGLDRSKIFLGYDSVDNGYFSAKAAEIKNQCPGIRDQYQLPENYFLASSRFVEKKNLLRLIQAYAQYRERIAKATGANGPGKAWKLVLLGDGPLQGSICDQIQKLHLTDQVLMHGFKQYGELPAYYGLANVFIHASTTEQWGLVVNEAMASGLPVLVSNRCGCAMDLVEPGVTGYSFDPLNLEQMTELMLRCSASPADLATMGKAAAERVAEWGVERFADGLNRAAVTAMQAPSPRASVLDWLQINLLLQFKGSISV